MAGATSKNDHLLDQIFKDPDVKHGLKLFDSADFDQLDMWDDAGKIYVRCHATGKDRRAKPEEVIRQLVLHWVEHGLGYAHDQVAIEVPVKMGSTYADKAADIVIYTAKDHATPRIIIEVKKPKRQDGLDQLQSYMNATGVHYGGWVNGNDSVYQLRSDPNFFEDLKRLPGPGEDLDDVKTPIKKSELRPVEELKDEIQYLENTVLASAGVSAFDEIFKLIFAKLFDEFDKGDDETVEFRTTTAPLQDQYDRINSLFHKAAHEWPDIFSENDNIELTPQALVAVASAFQTRRFYDADLDVIDAAFEYMINPEQKGDKGQYFTPRPVVKMCARMLDPQPGETVLDPACGPGGFLIHALNWVMEHYLRPKYKTGLEKRKIDYAIGRLFGMDFDWRLARVAKAMMLIAGDGRSNIFRVSTLDSREWEGRPDGLKTAVKPGSFDVILTNPPFAGNITSPEILGGYDLAYTESGGQRRRLKRMTRDVLFIEKCLEFLKPGGRLAIVLPQGNLNNTQAERIREWVRDRARVLGVVGLHGNTFKPFTNTKTSVLILQKWREDEEPPASYPIFMAVNQVPLKDNRGNYIFRLEEDGGFQLDGAGKRLVEHDFDEIADAFEAFLADQDLNLHQ